MAETGGSPVRQAGGRGSLGLGPAGLLFLKTEGNQRR